MRITFWGTRGSIPVPGPETAYYGGNTSCVEVCLDDGARLIFDAGTGIRLLGDVLMETPSPINAYLFLSHVHWDHIQGLPFFAPAFMPNTTLNILGPEEAYSSLEQTLSDQMRSPYFPIPMNAMAGKMQFQPLATGSVFQLSSQVRIEVIGLNHPGQTLGYRLNAEGKVVVYATDHEPFGSDALTQHLVQSPRLLDLAADADLLIQDAQYTPAEYPQRLGWGHSTYIDALNLAREARVKQLALYHHDPGHSDDAIDRVVADSQAWIQTEQATFTCFAASEGYSLVL